MGITEEAASMKFKPEISSIIALTGDLEREYAQARDLGKVRLGKHFLFFRKFSGVSFLPYSQIVRAWLRQEEVKARMCCGTANFDQFYVVMDCADGRQRRGQVPDKDTGKAALDHFAGKNRSVKIGYVKP